MNENKLKIKRSWKQKQFNKVLENSILSVLEEFIIPNTLTVDVGGNSGYQTYYHQKFNKVRTYEPVPFLFEILKQNMKQLGVDDCITFVNKAVGEKDGEIVLYVDMNRMSMTSQIPLMDNVQKISVPVVCLDNDVTEKTGFIKVDVEGYELDVLNGAKKLIDRDSPTMMVEIYQPWCEKTNIKIEDYFKFFESIDYSAMYFSCTEKKLIKISSIDHGVNCVKLKHAEHDGDFLFVRK